MAHPLPATGGGREPARPAEAFEQLGGFYEGLRAAEDTDFSWRLQRAGWRLELRPERTSCIATAPPCGELRRQWRGYAAGRAWLARRYEDFEPEPAVRGCRAGARGAGPAARSGWRRPPGALRVGPGRFLALDALLAGEELAGFALSNRPVGHARPTRRQACARGRALPGRGDPLVDFARTLEDARVEATARPEASSPRRRATCGSTTARTTAPSRGPRAARAVRPAPAPRWTRPRAPNAGAPTLSALAPAVRRSPHDPGRAGPAPRDGAQATARRLAPLAGRRLERAPPLMRVHIVDPSAFTPPYDHALCAALARPAGRGEAGHQPFRLRAAPEPDGYTGARLLPPGAGRRRIALRRAAKLAEHVPDMLRYRARRPRRGRRPLPWLDVPWLDSLLLPRAPVVLRPTTCSRASRARARPRSAAAVRRGRRGDRALGVRPAPARRGARSRRPTRSTSSPTGRSSISPEATGRVPLRGRVGRR